MNLIKQIFRRFVRLANEAALTATNLIGLTNEVTDGEWLQLSPLGDFPHAQGLQRVDRTAAEAMANHFNGILASAKRALFGGVPFYVGHPDVPNMANDYPDKGAKGWIKALEARADGLYGRVEWNPRGTELIANKEYKFFSPFWEAKEIGSEAGRRVYQPMQLLSVGFTNTPNLPVKPLANDRLALAPLANVLGLDEASSAEVILKTVETLANQKATLEKTNKTLSADFATERSERITIILDNAIRENRITLAERPDWQTKFTADFANTLKAISEKKQTDLNTTSQTADLGKDKRALENERTRQTALLAFISEKMAAGLSYEQAWALAKKELAGLFEQMGKR
jgi:phage I-like protein